MSSSLDSTLVKTPIPRYCSTVDSKPSDPLQKAVAPLLERSMRPLRYDDSLRVDENFQSADMDRLEQDENSGWQHLEDLPTAPPKYPKYKVSKNLNLNVEHGSSLSGVFAGEVQLRDSLFLESGEVQSVSHKSAKLSKSKTLLMNSADEVRTRDVSSCVADTRNQRNCSGSTSSGSLNPSSHESRKPQFKILSKNVCSGDTRLKHADPLIIHSSHTQMSWSSTSPGSRVPQTFALQNKGSSIVDVLVQSTNASFLVSVEGGEQRSKLILTFQPHVIREITIIFSPKSIGPIIGELTISRYAASESSSEDKKVVPLYGFCGRAKFSVTASKDRFSLLSVTMRFSGEVSDNDASHPPIIASFTVKNCGQVSAYISLHISREIPFKEGCVSVSPAEVTIQPGELKRVTVHFDPDRDVLRYIRANTHEVLSLASLILCYSELSNWQRIRRIFEKYHTPDSSGLLCHWGTLFTGDIGVGRELKDDQSAESVLIRSLSQKTISVLVDLTLLDQFDLNDTLVFEELVAEKTTKSGQLNERTLDSSKDLASRRQGDNVVFSKEDSFGSPESSTTSASKINLQQQDSSDESDVSTMCDYPEVSLVEFPETGLNHENIININIRNPSQKKNQVSISSLSCPFSVLLPKFHLPPDSSVKMSVIFRPVTTGMHDSTMKVLIDGKHGRTFRLQGKCVNVEREYKCKLCPKAYLYKNGLNRHEREKHPEMEEGIDQSTEQSTDVTH